jgi:uncharacterized protein involved in exopolysaccharide biosynthesis
MNQSYVQTFKRHRLLFSLPVIIMTVLALWFVVATPKQYKAGASLFVDTPVTQASSFLDPNPGDVPPAAQTQQLLSELLATRSFRLKVGHKGPLTQYLAEHPSEGWGPKGLLRKLRGTQSADDRTWDALDAKHVMTALPGGQVLSIELHGPTPEVAVGTLSALIQTLKSERRDIDVARQQSAVTHFKNEMDTASRRIQDIDARVASAPEEAPAFEQARKAAETRLKRGARGYNQAVLSLAAAKEAGAPTYRLIDKPALPAPAVGGLKKSLFGVVAGIFVGCLISFLAIVLLTGSEDKREREELREVIARADEDEPLDVDQATGTNGSAVPHVPRAKAKHER